MGESQLESRWVFLVFYSRASTLYGSSSGTLPGQQKFQQHTSSRLEQICPRSFDLPSFGFQIWKKIFANRAAQAYGSTRSKQHAFSLGSCCQASSQFNPNIVGYFLLCIQCVETTDQTAIFQFGGNETNQSSYLESPVLLTELF